MKWVVRINAASPKRRKRLETSGFTLLESLIIVAIVGILAAIAVPSGLEFLNTQTLNRARDEVNQAMRQGQGNARQSRTLWQTSFREQNGEVQWANHPTTVNPASATWKSLGAGIRLDEETTLLLSSGVRRIRWDSNGNVSGQLGRLTLSGKTSSQTKRCVIVSTLLGALRVGENRRTKQDGRFCY